MTSALNGNDSGSNDTSRGRGCKIDKTRRSWTFKEEDVLIASLKELVANGWKSDNGFRAGYLSKLEEAMRKGFPDTDLKGMPHINSKLSAWKKSYNSICLMLRNSGVGFNSSGTFMIDCDNEQWAAILRKDNNARLMRYKSWPMFEDWKEVFGKDRATGEHAEDLVDAANDMINEGNVAEAQAESGTPVHSDGDNENAGVETSVCQSREAETKVRGSSKKRKSHNELEGVYAILGEIARATDKRLEILASRIGYEFDLAQARKEAFDQLTMMPGLSMYDKFDACELLAFKVERLQIFMSMPHDARAQYVMRLLEMHAK